MEYKYYKRDGENFILKRPMGLLYVAMVLLTLTGALGILAAVATGGYGGYIWFLCCISFVAIGYYRHKFTSICIRPATRTVLVKRGSKTNQQYPFDQFLNFQKTRVKGNGITTQYHVIMYFNESGKNKGILLGAVFLQKTADRIIIETDTLIRKV